jgi:hypothetical protein
MAKVSPGTSAIFILTVGKRRVSKSANVKALDRIILKTGIETANDFPAALCLPFVVRPTG